MDVEIGRETLMALAAIAWADGVVDPAEADGIRATAKQLGLGDADVQAVEQALASGVGLDQVETLRMSRLTRLFTYAAAVWIAQIDGAITPQEQQTIDLLGDRLGLSGVARDRARNVAIGLTQAPPSDRPGGYDLIKLKSKLSAGLSQIGND